MKILFTGASSFTGYWFVNTLTGAGHEVICALQGSIDKYEGVRLQRAKNLKATRIVPQTPFGSDAFLQLIRDGGAWDLLCHHAADVTNYRSPDFDALGALRNNSLNLPAVLAACKERGLKAIALTGSVFENDEGTGDEPLRAFSPYGLSKALTFQIFRYYCGMAGMTLGKFVIPNPFGPFEEPRFTAYLMRTWKDGKTAGVKTPDYIRDNIHASLLADVYAKFAAQAAASPPGGFLKIGPSGYPESQGAFALRVAREVRARLGWKCELDLARQEDFSEPLARLNRDPAARLVPAWNETAAWDAFVKYYEPG
jgi:UDP-glucose 4-epimerase